jgi:hypothetical protein
MKEFLSIVRITLKSFGNNFNNICGDATSILFSCLTFAFTLFHSAVIKAMKFLYSSSERFISGFTKNLFLAILNSLDSNFVPVTLAIYSSLLRLNSLSQSIKISEYFSLFLIALVFPIAGCAQTIELLFSGSI